ncbi:hypothetical protein BCR42DRAFT_445489 [Absidia repens]|uniref:Uncharacterized protein n=1 Tax=Absidia repens TaxID=90262 RepID=A0A1X2J1Q1_9FUNG|nr:hypothetical protein BCR42DRAFT_445489 [Absidia repens]
MMSLHLSYFGSWLDLNTDDTCYDNYCSDNSLAIMNTKICYQFVGAIGKDPLQLPLVLSAKARTTSTTIPFRSKFALFGVSVHHAVQLSSVSSIEMIETTLILGSFCYFSLFNLARSSGLFSGITTRSDPIFF